MTLIPAPFPPDIEPGADPGLLCSPKPPPTIPDTRPWLADGFAVGVYRMGMRTPDQVGPDSNGGYEEGWREFISVVPTRAIALKPETNDTEVFRTTIGHIYMLPTGERIGLIKSSPDHAEQERWTVVRPYVATSGFAATWGVEEGERVWVGVHQLPPVVELIVDSDAEVCRISI